MHNALLRQSKLPKYRQKHIVFTPYILLHMMDETLVPPMFRFIKYKEKTCCWCNNIQKIIFKEHFASLQPLEVSCLIILSCLLIQTKKKLVGLTREHEALYNFVESNKQICTEKEKQKVERLWHWRWIPDKPRKVFIKDLFPVVPFRCWTGSQSQLKRRRGWMRSTLKSTWRVIRWGSSWKTH